MKQKEFAVYRGDNYLFMGTKRECVRRLGISPSMMNFYCTPSYRRRLENSIDTSESIIVVDLTGWEDEDEWLLQQQTTSEQNSMG